MPRPRRHDIDMILDVAEELVVEAGRDGLTVRALAARSGASNGSIYHTFGTVEAVLARAWLRRATEFLVLQRRLVDEAGSPAPDDLPGPTHVPGVSRRAVVAAATAPVVFAEQHARAGVLLTRVSRDQLLTPLLSPELRGELEALDDGLGSLMHELAAACFGRRDAGAVEVIAVCLVRLPAALAFPDIRRGRVPPLVRSQLVAAVEAVLGCGPPPR
jgi:AcrR family transcriptional regulator